MSSRANARLVKLNKYKKMRTNGTQPPSSLVYGHPIRIDGKAKKYTGRLWKPDSKELDVVCFENTTEGFMRCDNCLQYKHTGEGAVCLKFREFVSPKSTCKSWQKKQEASNK